MWRKVTVLAPSFALMSTFSISPALAAIADAFPHLSVSAVQLLNTIPFLVGLPTILFSGRLASHFTKKRLLTIALVLMLLGGLIPLVQHESYGILLFSMVIYGFGFGAITPLSTALIHEHFSGPERPWMMGMQSAVIGLGGVCFSNLGGQLASVEWWHTYFSFFLLVPVLVLTLCLPKGIIVEKEEKKQRFFNAPFVLLLVLVLLSSSFNSIFNTNTAMLIQEAGFGDSSVSGGVLSVFSLAGIAGGFVAGWFILRLKRFTLSFVFIISAVAFLVIFVSPALGIIAASVAVYGFFVSLRMPAAFMEATRYVPDKAATMAIALTCCASYIGQFISPFLVNSIAELIRPGAAIKYLVGAVAFLLLATVALITRLKPRVPT